MGLQRIQTQLSDFHFHFISALSLDLCAYVSPWSAMTSTKELILFLLLYHHTPSLFLQALTSREGVLKPKAGSVL